MVCPATNCISLCAVSMFLFPADRWGGILTEAMQFFEGAESGRIHQERLPEGVSDVFVAVPRRGGRRPWR